MERLERWLSQVAPVWALKRAQARAQLDVVRNYEASTDSHLRRRVRDLGGGNALMDRSQVKLRDWARHLSRDVSTAAAIIRNLSSRTMSCHVVPAVEDRAGNLLEQVNEDLTELWAEWSDAAETTGLLDWSSLCQLIGDSWYRDGEIFSYRMLGSGRFPYRTRVPLVLQVLESDYLPISDGIAHSSGLHGMERGRAGNVTHYHFYREHPNDAVSGFNLAGLETIRLPIDLVDSLALRSRAGQLRGHSILAPVITTLADRNDYKTAEVTSAKFAACIGIAIERSVDPAGGGFAASTLTDERVFNYEPGMTFDGLPGESVKMLQADRPSQQFAPFLRELTREAAIGTGASYSTISADYSGTYSSQRQMMLEVDQFHRQMQRVAIARFHRPVWRAFVQGAMLAGLVPQLSRIDPRTLLRADFVPEPLPWIDPQKEGQALKLAQDEGWESRWGIIRRRGGDVRRIDREIDRDDYRAQAYPVPGDAQAA